jgi:hypothetical protein
MSPLQIAIIAIVVIALAVVIWLFLKTKRTKQLHARFGPEYERTVRSEGTARAAEKVLQERQQRVAGLEITPLTEQQRNRFAEAWDNEQAHFVDEPRAAVESADQLVGDVMKARGYPVEEFDQRAADISVEHPQLVANYRAAHEIAVRHRQGKAGTEDLRAAFIGYRSMFEELLGTGAQEPVT